MGKGKTMECAMNGGDGPFSYARNSCYQREAVDGAKSLITDSIFEKLDIQNQRPSGSCSNTFRIADLGSSVGPNTFIAVQNIIQAIELKYRKTALQQENPTLEFQVIFNDLANNDFNTLFATLPAASRQYFAAGVPGSFHGRLFPAATLHIAHSSHALNWLSRIPQQVVDRNSPAWNKGSVHYTRNATVFEAYSGQFKKDMEAFFSARAQEMVGGGLVLLLIPGCQDGVLPSETCMSLQLGLLASCFMDMVKMGMVSEEKVDSFNLPLYLTSPMELRELIEANGHFHIERLEDFNPYVIDNLSIIDLEALAVHLRAAIEGLIIEHFGTDINIVELFQRFTKKLVDNFHIFDVQYRKEFIIFASLKRKLTDQN